MALGSQNVNTPEGPETIIELQLEVAVRRLLIISDRK